MRSGPRLAPGPASAGARFGDYLNRKEAVYVRLSTSFTTSWRQLFFQLASVFQTYW